MKKLLLVAIVAIVSMFIVAGCVEYSDSDSVQSEQQETMLQEATSSVGMPAIKNFRERRLLKEILELRDQEGLVTYTYIVNELTGKLIYLGETVGYGIPYATQYTNPMKSLNDKAYDGGDTILPQADPNGLFSPQSAEGTWILLKNPNGGEVKPVYVEPRIIVSPFKLNI
jgi:hypothetical protein